MKQLLIFLGAPTLIMLASLLSSTQLERQETPDLDAYWAIVSQTVADGDFEGYAATYHPDAILVNESQNATYPISTALANWKEGFMDTKAGKMKASVEFRWTRRLSDATTAHETGIFHYVATSQNGQVQDSYLHFEALLINKDGWKMMMEYQKLPATIEQWNAAK